VLVKVVVDGMSGWGAKLQPAKLPYLSAARVETFLLEMMRNLCNKSGEFILI
jgi:hypothetical protein